MSQYLDTEAVVVDDANASPDPSTEESSSADDADLPGFISNETDGDSSSSDDEVKKTEDVEQGLENKSKMPAGVLTSAVDAATAMGSVLGVSLLLLAQPSIRILVTCNLETQGSACICEIE